MPIKPIKILLVEDNPGDARLIKETLSEAAADQFELTCTERLDLALEHVAQNEFDVVLLDLTLPDSSGLNTFERMHAQAPTIPTIVLTGLDVQTLGTEALQKGAQDYLIKGQVDTPLLVRSVRYAIARKLLENQLLQSNMLESVGELAGGVAHEFNNLLTSIMGYTQLGITGLAPGDPVRSDLEAVLKSAERASKLASQLLAFSRQEVSEPEVFDLNQLILNSGKLLRSVFEKDVEFIILLSPELNLVSADPNQIDQVLMNLAVNARDAMPTGGKLVIETTNLNVDQAQADQWNCPPGKYVSLTVNDNGIGMSEEVKRKVFDPFYTTKETGKGTGLGLSICYGIIKQNGGHIEVDSETGNGTTFKIFLPCSTQEVSLLPQNQERQEIPNGKETILLVEDEPMIRSLCMRVLYDNGYIVLEAANGEEALRLVQSHPAGMIDLLLTDVVMPRMGGIELAGCLRESRPDIKILLTSGYTDEAPILACSPNDNIPFLQKPFLPSVLLSQVREVLDS